MSKRHPLALGALALMLVQPLGADELESLFDSANSPKADSAPAATAEIKESAFARFMRTQLPSPHPDQSLFIRFFEAGEWQKALLQYPVAFEGKEFQKSANGRALFAYTHFKAGLQITGLELLFKSVSAPSQLHPEVRKLWTDAAPANHFAWEQASIRWNPAYLEVFSPQVALIVAVRELASLKKADELKALQATLSQDSASWARVGWQLVVVYSLSDRVEDAAKALAEVMKSSYPPVSRDLMEITAARLLYQRAHFAAAIKYYEKVGKDSEYWMDAQEEIAWAYVRRGEPQNAMAVTRSLIAPALQNQTGPEAFFVHSLAQLKICDYPGVIQSLGEFAKRFKARTTALTKLSTTSEAPPVNALIALLKDKRIQRKDLKENAVQLPRMVARDDRLYQFAQAYKYFEAEAAAADQTYAMSLALTGLQGYFDQLKQTLEGRSHTAKALASTRVKELAKQESDEIKAILRKLHIVEAEVIQQVAVAETVARKTASENSNDKKGTTGSKDRDVLKFPAEDEMWFDEIGQYRIDVKKVCHAKAKGKTL